MCRCIDQQNRWIWRCVPSSAIASHAQLHPSLHVLVHSHMGSCRAYIDTSLQMTIWHAFAFTWTYVDTVLFLPMLGLLYMGFAMFWQGYKGVHSRHVLKLAAPLSNLGSLAGPWQRRPWSTSAMYCWDQLVQWFAPNKSPEDSKHMPEYWRKQNGWRYIDYIWLL